MLDYADSLAAIAGGPARETAQALGDSVNNWYAGTLRSGS